LEQVYNLLVANTGRTPQFSIMLYTADAPIDACEPNDAGMSVITTPLSLIEIECDPAVSVATFQAIGYTPLRINLRVAQDELTRFLVREFYAPLWENSDVPAWFRVGLEHLYTSSAKPRLIDETRAADRANATFTMLDMLAPDQSDLSRWEAQSYGMVLYIADQAGVPAVFQLARPVGDGASFSQSYEALVGRPLSALIPAWSNWIFSNTALTAADLNLYRGPTPVPTPTSTATPFPPTATSTPTDTATASPTPTVTGFLSATPLPSLTPTHTHTPAPPSVTPRPAGFRPPVASTPTNQQASQDNDETSPVVIVIVGAIFVLLAGLIIYLYRISGEPRL
jgi:hypothetical protein